MSYNVSQWKTKEIRDFRIPTASLFKDSRDDRRPKKEYLDDGSVKYNFDSPDFLWLAGSEDKDGYFHLVALQLYGEWGGIIINDVLESAFADSTGYLEAVLIWESGDSINRLIVDNGKVTWEEIEL